MAKKTNKWYMHNNEYDDVIVSSRVRFARNLYEFPFQEKLTNEDSARLVDRIRALTPEIAGREGKEYYSCDVSKLTELDKTSMVESHILSPALVGKNQHTGLILSDDESVSIMINEEDHLRIQSVAGGCNMREAFETASRIDDFLDSRVGYAFSDKYGYLTSCITNLGTGMRASYMLSLPALTIAGKIPALQEEIGKFGAVMRGIYGEGSKSSGFMYQISNQKTLGCPELEIVDNLNQIVGQIVTLERRRRDAWLENEHDELEDKIYRSYGVLRYTKKITTKDAMMLLAQLKLGSDLDIISLTGNGSDIHRLMVEIQPAMLQKNMHRTMEAPERDKVRAKYINDRLPSMLQQI